MLPKFPKPSQVHKQIPAVKVYPCGREVCGKGKAGRKEYKRRVKVMWERQGGKCGLQITEYCKMVGGYMALEYATFEHIDGRGGGRRDDRTGIDGKPYNLASCGTCNFHKGSRRFHHLEK